LFVAGFTPREMLTLAGAVIALPGFWVLRREVATRARAAVQ
jgi:hypothetical protein